MPYAFPKFLVDSLRSVRGDVSDDSVDKLNSVFTVTLLIFFVSLIGVGQFFGSPVKCMPPREFEQWNQYFDTFCFAENKYFRRIDRPPVTSNEPEEQHIVYYQWICLFLAMQAFFFYLPKWLWQTVQHCSGLDMNAAIKEASTLQMKTGEKRSKALNNLVDFIDQRLQFQHKPKCHIFSCCMHFLSMCYLVRKLLYVVNVILQLLFVNDFVGDGSLLWGINLCTGMFSGKQWIDTGYFPRYTFCDVPLMKRRDPAVPDGRGYVRMQCVLMINVMNEKIFAFLWFWLVIVLVCNVSNVIEFIFCLSPYGRGRRLWSYMQSNSEEMKGLNKHHRAAFITLDNFVNQHLASDGLLLLRFIKQEAGDLVVRDLTQLLYDRFAERNRIERLNHVDIRNVYAKNQKDNKQRRGLMNESSMPLFESPFMLRGKERRDFFA